VAEPRDPPSAHQVSGLQFFFCPNSFLQARRMRLLSWLPHGLTGGGFVFTSFDLFQLRGFALRMFYHAFVGPPFDSRSRPHQLVKQLPAFSDWMFRGRILQFIPPEVGRTADLTPAKEFEIPQRFLSSPCGVRQPF